VKEPEKMAIQHKVAVSTPSLQEAYRSLLLEDWTDTSFRKVIAILWDEIGNQKVEVPDWWSVLDPHGVRHTENVNAFVVERIRVLTETMPHSSVPQVPQVIPGDAGDELARLTETVWTYLIIQSLTHIAGEQGFLADTQSALFICCADYLLPRLHNESYAARRDCLLAAMYSHTFLVWRNTPAHMYYLQSVLMNELGNYSERFRLLGDSLALTPASDHSYLTKAQNYLSDLLDVKRYDVAERLLMDLYRSATRDDQPEIMEMFRSTRMAMMGIYA